MAKAVGRLSGDRVPALAISGDGLTLLRGSDGFDLWSRRGQTDDVTRLGPVRPGHARALALVNAFEMGEQSSNGTGRESAVVDIRAITAADTVVWHRHVKVTIKIAKGQPNGGSASASARGFGDVEPDGTVDFAVRVALRLGHTRLRKVGIVNGRNGALTRRLIGRRAAGSLVRGPGTDLLRAAGSSAGIVVSGYDGATRTRLVRRVVVTPGHVRHPFVAGLRVTGHDCSDIETGGIYRHGREIADLLSASGVRLWSVRLGRSQLTGGHVVRYHAPHHFCAASPAPPRPIA
jgi:hypothetical protein